MQIAGLIKNKKKFVSVLYYPLECYSCLRICHVDDYDEVGILSAVSFMFEISDDTI